MSDKNQTPENGTETNQTPEIPKDKKENPMPEPKKTLPQKFDYNTGREPKHADGSNHGALWFVAIAALVLAIGGLALGSVNYSDIGGLTTLIKGHSTDIANLVKENDARKAENDDMYLNHVMPAEDAISGLKVRMNTAEGTINAHGKAITDAEKNIVWLTGQNKKVNKALSENAETVKNQGKTIGQYGQNFEKVNGTLVKHDDRLDSLEKRPMTNKANPLSTGGPTVLWCAGSLNNRFGCLNDKPVEKEVDAIKLACGPGGSKNVAKFENGTYGDFAPVNCN